MPINPARKIWLTLLAIASLTLAAFITITLGSILMNPFANWIVQDTDFSTNQERLAHVNQAMQINLPQSTTIVSFHQEGFQDWSMDVEAKLPANDIPSFVQSLPPLDQPAPQTFKGDVGADWITMTIDLESSTIHIEYISP